ncbi:hypothetical protein [Spirosoma flavum]|uniref:Uncharacterized protein n=1 Tax=Spirosoma flavum TaxID=2048557 RepID=A0ABW6ALI1_9BACT
MPAILELERKVVFKEGRIVTDIIRSTENGQPLSGFRTIIFFEDIEYIDFESSKKEAELHLSLFFGFQNSSINIFLSKFLGEIWLFKELVGRNIKLPINPEPDYNENSVYINYAHAPIDVSNIKIIRISDNKLIAEITMIFLGKYEESFQNLSTVKLIKLDILTNR